MTDEVVLGAAEHDRLFGALLAAQAESAELHARVALLEDQNERLRGTLTAARDAFKGLGFPVYADCCEADLND